MWHLQRAINSIPSPDQKWSTGENLTKFESKSVVVTGGTRGIGREIVRALIANGHKVGTISRSSEGLQNLEAETRMFVGEHSLVAEQVDLLSYPISADREICSVQEILSHPKFCTFINSVARKFGKLDSFIMNAGITGLNPNEPIDVSQWIFSSLAQSVAVAPHLAKSQGVLFFITSPLTYELAQLEQIPKSIEPYICMKGGIELRLQSSRAWLEKEYGWNRICIVDIGSVNTNMHQEAMMYGEDVIRKRTEQKRQEGKLRDPAEVGRVLSAMATTQCKFNAENGKFDIPIKGGERILLSEEVLKVASAA